MKGPFRAEGLSLTPQCISQESLLAAEESLCAWIPVSAGLSHSAEMKIQVWLSSLSSASPSKRTLSDGETLEDLLEPPHYYGHSFAGQFS